MTARRRRWGEVAKRHGGCLISPNRTCPYFVSSLLSGHYLRSVLSVLDTALQQLSHARRMPSYWAVDACGASGIPRKTAIAHVRNPFESPVDKDGSSQKAYSSANLTPNSSKNAKGQRRGPPGAANRPTPPPTPIVRSSESRLGVRRRRHRPPPPPVASILGLPAPKSGAPGRQRRRTPAGLGEGEPSGVPPGQHLRDKTRPRRCNLLRHPRKARKPVGKKQRKKKSI